MKPLIGLFVAASLVAALIAGLDGLLYIATLGTAIGTVGLAFSTWRLSLLTQSTVEQTQIELKVAEEGVIAATQSAKEAQRSRIDGGAPIVEITVGAPRAYYGLQGQRVQQVPLNRPNGPALEQSQVDGWELWAEFPIELINLGKTPAYFRLLGNGPMTLNRADDQFRIAVKETAKLTAKVLWTGGINGDPTVPLEVALKAEVWRPMTGETMDEVIWQGVITLLRNFGGKGDRYQDAEDFRTIGYRINRRYAGEQERKDAA